MPRRREEDPGIPIGPGLLEAIEDLPPARDARGGADRGTDEPLGAGLDQRPNDQGWLPPQLRQLGLLVAPGQAPGALGVSAVEGPQRLERQALDAECPPGRLELVAGDLR